MTDFNYTLYNDEVRSSLVDEVYYNENNRELLIDLNDDLYVYTGVPLSEYEGLLASESKGRYYQTIKRNYGPGEFVGTYGDVNYVKISPQAAVGTPKALTYAADATITSTNTRVTLGDDGYNTFTNVIPEGVKFKHEVVFAVDGLDSERTYTTEAGSVDEAVSNLSKATAALGLDVDVKRVTVHFG